MNNNIENQIDKNLNQLLTNHHILDEQEVKIDKINNNIENIDNNNKYSYQILKRLSNIYYRFFNPRIYGSSKLYRENKLYSDNRLFSNSVFYNNRMYDNPIELRRDEININFNQNIDKKLHNFKNLAFSLGNKLDNQNEKLENLNQDMEKCENNILKNNISIENILK